jgi:hypothetical protein
MICKTEIGIRENRDSSKSEIRTSAGYGLQNNASWLNNMCLRHQLNQ